MVEIGTILIVGGAALVYVVGSAVWKEIVETADQVQEGEGPNIFSYTCEHCGNTIVDWIQDPLVTEVLRCPRCNNPLENQQRAADIAHGYFEDLEDDGW